ncbi:MAG: efflux RND transporter periplasmic adaptor subunit [Pseudomonadota bacterium]
MKRFMIYAAALAIGAAVLAGIAFLIVELGHDHSHDDKKPHAHVESQKHDGGHKHDGGEKDDHGNDEHIKLTDAQVKAAGIVLAEARGGTLQQHFLVPGAITADADNMARVAVRLVGTVAELPKRLGDNIEKGEIVAVIESREVSDAKSEYLAARLSNELQQLFATRQKMLWDNRTTTENEYLRTRLTAQEAQIRFSSARQKLFALGLEEADIAVLPDQPVETLRKQALRAPIKGRVAERRVDLGALVGREGQESELFVIVNLDQVWVDLAVSPGDISKVAEGREITVRNDTTGLEAKAKIVFVSPLLDKETRNARVIATLDNPGHVWLPGSFITAEIPLGGAPAKILLPKQALQTVGGNPVLFVREGDAFEPRKVKTGREDDDQVEILSGVEAGETVAIANTFILKAELGKSEAEHAH